jgi:predicted HTH transcriptional regulator
MHARFGIVEYVNARLHERRRCVKCSDIEKLRENDHFEAKSARGGLPHSIWETYSAFANTFGGIIALGVEEDLSDHSLHPTGLDDAQAIVDEFWRVLDAPHKVSVNILREDDVVIEDLEGHAIVLVTVPQARAIDRPVFIDGDPVNGTYWRSGEADLRCERERIEAMLRSSGRPERTLGELARRVADSRFSPDYNPYPKTDR